MNRHEYRSTELPIDPYRDAAEGKPKNSGRAIPGIGKKFRDPKH